MSKNKKENTGTTSSTLEMTQARLDAAKDLVRIKQSKGIKDAKLSIYEVLEEEIMKLDIPDKEKAARLSRLLKVRNKKVNIMLVGSTGVGKSSTINALFNTDVATVGVGVDPETSLIEKYKLDNLIIWDTPGLGDGVVSDERIKRLILGKLNEMDENGDPLIDLVLVILDASSKDLGTSYDLINNLLIPALGENAEKCILLALNQADVAMKGKHWLEEENMPDETLKEFLGRKADSVQKRIYEATDLSIRPIYYCAGYKEANGEQHKPYNLTKLLYYIVKSVPMEKRIALADNINEEEDNWLFDDREEDYKENTKYSFGETVYLHLVNGLFDGSDIGESILGIPGRIIGATVGATFGVVKGVLAALFD